MKKAEKLPKKPAPIWQVILADVLLLAVSMSVFCYFHHIRDLWGIGASGAEAMETVSLDPVDVPVIGTEVSDTEEAGAAEEPETDMGDFGASFPHVFAEGEKITLMDDTEIRNYMAENGLTVTENKAGSYVGLYRSGDVYLTAEKVDTILSYNNKQYVVEYYLYDVYVRNLENLYTAAVNSRVPIEQMSDASYMINGIDGETYVTYPAVLSVNGDYWGNKNHTLLAVRNNEILRDSDYILADICVLYNDGTMETITAEEFDYGAVMGKNPYQIWEFGPELLDDEGKAIETFDEKYYDDHVIDQRNPRTAIGYYEPGHYCFLVVDGRSEQSKGVRVIQLGWLFEELGCTVAYNLDGGDSALSYFNGEYHRTDEERALEGEDQRELYDIISIGEVMGQ